MIKTINSITEKLLTKQIILYLIFGVLTTLVNILLYIFFVDLCQINYIIGNVLSWFFSVVFAYVTNRIWVFESKNEKILLEFSFFVGGRIFSGVLDTSLMFIFVSILLFDDLISKIVINVIVVIINYLLSRDIVFK